MDCIEITALVGTAQSTIAKTSVSGKTVNRKTGITNKQTYTMNFVPVLVRSTSHVLPFILDTVARAIQKRRKKRKKKGLKKKKKKEKKKKRKKEQKNAAHFLFISL